MAVECDTAEGCKIVVDTGKLMSSSADLQLDLIDRYPEYNFIATSAQQYSWLEELYPDVFARVQDQVKQDRFGESRSCLSDLA